MTSPLAEDPDTLASEISALKLTAATLLLRSPRLSLSQILELLDIGDAECRDMTRDNAQIQTLLGQRRAGTPMSAPDSASGGVRPRQQTVRSPRSLGSMSS